MLFPLLTTIDVSAAACVFRYHGVMRALGKELVNGPVLAAQPVQAAQCLARSDVPLAEALGVLTSAAAPNMEEAVVVYLTSVLYARPSVSGNGLVTTAGPPVPVPTPEELRASCGMPSVAHSGNAGRCPRQSRDGAGEAQETPSLSGCGVVDARWWEPLRSIRVPQLFCGAVLHNVPTDTTVQLLEQYVRWQRTVVSGGWNSPRGDCVAFAVF